MKTIRLTLLLLILFPVSVGVVSACKTDHRSSAQPGNVVREPRSVPAFTGIRVGGAFEIYLKQGTTQEVVVETESDIMKYVTTEVSGGVLRIGMKDHPNNWLHDVDVLKVYITCTNLDLLDLSGAVELTSDGRLTLDKLGMEVSGAVESRLDLAVQKLDLNLSGAAELTFTGTAGDVTADASGASEIDAFALQITNLTLYGSGAVEAKVTVSGSLKANMSGACSVRYKGNPRVDVHSSGASDVKRVD